MLRSFFISTHNQCDIRCRMCYLGEEWRDLEFSDVTRDRLVALPARYIGMSGGETLINAKAKDFFVRVRERQPDAKLYIVTNGQRAPENQLWMRECGLWSMRVSIDAATDETYAYVRGGRSLTRVLDGLRLCRQMFPGMDIQINYLIHRKNMHEVPLAVEVYSDPSLAISRLFFQPLLDWHDHETYEEWRLRPSDLAAVGALRPQFEGTIADFDQAVPTDDGPPDGPCPVFGTTIMLDPGGNARPCCWNHTVLGCFNEQDADEIVDPAGNPVLANLTNLANQGKHAEAGCPDWCPSLRCRSWDKVPPLFERDQ